MFLTNPFRGRDVVDGASQKRIRTVSALYRIMNEAFGQRRSCKCSCQLPVVFRREPPSAAGEPNWQVETLWCGCHDCQRTLREVVATHAPLFLVKDASGPEEE